MISSNSENKILFVRPTYGGIGASGLEQKYLPFLILDTETILNEATFPEIGGGSR